MADHSKTLSISTTASLSESQVAERADFLSSVFQGSFLSVEYLTWLYGPAPFGAAVCFDARVDGRIVGHMAALPRTYKTERGDLPGILIVNTAVDPDYLRYGAFARLITEMKAYVAENNLQFVLGIPNRNAINGWVRRGGAHHMGSLDLFLRPFSPPGPALPPLEYTKHAEMQDWLCHDPVHHRKARGGDIVSQYNKVPYWLFSITSFGAAAPSKQGMMSLVNGYVGKGAKSAMTFKLPAFLKPAPLHIILITERQDVIDFFSCHDIQAKDFDVI